MNLIFKILILNVLFSGSSVCTCERNTNHQKEVEVEFQKSELVFVGEAISIEGNSKMFEIVVQEVFKGEIYPGQRVITNNDYQPCIPVVNGKGKWILYGRLEKNRFLTHECSLTRPFSDPIIHPLPPPPFPFIENYDSAKASQEYKKELLEFEDREKEILTEEILILKELKK